MVASSYYLFFLQTIASCHNYLEENIYIFTNQRRLNGLLTYLYHRGVLFARRLDVAVVYFELLQAIIPASTTGRIFTQR